MSRVSVCVCVLGHRCVYIADVRTVDACVDVLCSYVYCKCVSSFVISFFSRHVDLLFSFSLHLSLLSRPEQRSRSGREIRIFYFLSFFYLVDMSPFIIFFLVFFSIFPRRRKLRRRGISSRVGTLSVLLVFTLFLVFASTLLGLI